MKPGKYLRQTTSSTSTWMFISFASNAIECNGLNGYPGYSFFGAEHYGEYVKWYRWFCGTKISGGALEIFSELSSPLLDSLNDLNVLPEGDAG